MMLITGLEQIIMLNLRCSHTHWRFKIEVILMVIYLQQFSLIEIVVDFLKKNVAVPKNI